MKLTTHLKNLWGFTLILSYTTMTSRIQNNKQTLFVVAALWRVAIQN